MKSVGMTATPHPSARASNQLPSLTVKEVRVDLVSLQSTGSMAALRFAINKYQACRSGRPPTPEHNKNNDRGKT